MHTENNFDAALFDLDGTLIDSLADLANSTNTVLLDMGFDTHDTDAYKYFVGDGVELLARRALPANGNDEQTVARCVAAIRKEYGQRWAESTRPYTGIPELLDSLAGRGMRLVVLSNKPDDFTGQIVADLLADWRFELVVGARNGVPKKPDPTSALKIARQMDISPSKFVYVGDTSTDMHTAVAAGMYPVGALWGFRQADELIASGARALIEKPLDLLRYL